MSTHSEIISKDQLPQISSVVVFSDEVDFPSNHKEKVSRFIRELARIRSQNKNKTKM